MKLKYTLSLRQFNIITVFEDLDLNALPLDEIRGVLLDIYGTDSKPLISQFPSILVVILPQHQINIVVEGKRLQIVDLRAGEFEGRDILNFLRAAHQLNSLVSKGVRPKILAYGFNFHGGILLGKTGSKIDSAKKLIPLSIKNVSKFSKLLKANLIGSSFRAIYKRKDKRFDIRIEPVFGSKTTPTPRATVSYNIHFDSSSFPKFSELQRQFKNSRGYFESDLRDILTSRS